MTATQRIALVELGEEGPLRLSDLAKRMGTSTPTASRAVDALEALGLVDARTRIERSPRAQHRCDGARTRPARRAAHARRARVRAGSGDAVGRRPPRAARAAAPHDRRPPLAAQPYPSLCLSADSRRCASASESDPVHTRWFRSFSIRSTAAARGYGSGQRLRGSTGSPPSSRLIRWSSWNADGGPRSRYCREPFRLEGVRVRDRRPDRARPAVAADRRRDVRLRDRGVEHAGRERPARADDGPPPPPPEQRGSAVAATTAAAPATARSRPGRDASVQRYERRARPQVSIRDRHEVVTLSCDAVHIAPELYDLEYSFKDYEGEVATLEAIVRERHPNAKHAARRRLRDRQAPRASAARGSRAKGPTSTKGCCASPESASPDVPLHQRGHARLRPRTDVRRGHVPLQRDRLRRQPRRARGGGTQLRPRTSRRQGSRSSSRGSRPTCGWRTGRTCSPTKNRRLVLARATVSGLRDERISTTEMHYVVATPDGVEHFVEHHELYLLHERRDAQCVRGGGARRRLRRGRSHRSRALDLLAVDGVAHGRPHDDGDPRNADHVRLQPEHEHRGERGSEPRMAAQRPAQAAQATRQ